MSKQTKSPSADDVLAYVSRLGNEKPGHGLDTAFCFLYKEILVNRVLILEADPNVNRAGIEHNEKVINDLNRKLMEQMS